MAQTVLAAAVLFMSALFIPLTAMAADKPFIFGMLLVGRTPAGLGKPWSGSL